MSSCTAALQLALLACNTGAGDEVVTTSLPFRVTANAEQISDTTLSLPLSVAMPAEAVERVIEAVH